MANTILLSEPLVNTLMAQGWSGLRLQRGVSSTNLASFATVVDISYVASQTSYLYNDATGASTDWYRVARWGPSIEGAFSPPWPVAPTPTSVGDGARRSLRACRRM